MPRARVRDRLCSYASPAGVITPVLGRKWVQLASIEKVPNVRYALQNKWNRPCNAKSEKWPDPIRNPLLYPAELRALKRLTSILIVHCTHVHTCPMSQAGHPRWPRRGTSGCVASSSRRKEPLPVHERNAGKAGLHGECHQLFICWLASFSAALIASMDSRLSRSVVLTL